MKAYLIAALVSASACATAGSLEPPPGAPAPTFKTLQQIEPRTPLSQASSSGGTILINQPGSYYLTENIFQQGQAVTYDLILIASPFVTLDLNGFALGGSSEAAGGDGIQINASNVRVLNGTVGGFAGDGIKCLGVTGVNIINLSAIGNGGDGVDCGAVSTRDGDFSSNGGRGVVTVAASRIAGASALENSGSAIVVSTRAVVSGSTANTLIECGAGGGALVAETSGGTAGGNGIDDDCSRIRSVPNSP